MKTGARIILQDVSKISQATNGYSLRVAIIFLYVQHIQNQAFAHTKIVCASNVVYIDIRAFFKKVHIQNEKSEYVLQMQYTSTSEQNKYNKYKMKHIYI